MPSLSDTAARISQIVLESCHLLYYVDHSLLYQVSDNNDDQAVLHIDAHAALVWVG